MALYAYLMSLTKEIYSSTKEEQKVVQYVTALALHDVLIDTSTFLIMLANWKSVDSTMWPATLM
jgi:hypothetical protein